VRRFAIAIVVPALLAGACAGAPSGQEEELTAQAYPRESDAADDDANPEALEEPVAEDAGDAVVEGPDQAPDDAEDGPRPSDAAAYVDEHLPADALDHDVLLVNGPEAEPRLVLAVLTADREVNVETARWAQDGFDRVHAVDAGPAEVLGTLRMRRLGGDMMVALGLHREEGLRVGFWRLEAGQLQVPEQCPLDHPHRLRGQGSSEVVVGCEGARGPNDMLVWQDGAFVPRDQARPDRKAPPERAASDDRAEHEEPPEREERPAPPERREPPDRPDRSAQPEATDQQNPDRAQAKENRGAGADRARPGPPDHLHGRSAATNGPPGTQGRGPAGR
jgi:hypothetical protein